jgi:hypothetical protein
MRRHLHHALLFEQRVFRQHAVDRATERVGLHIGWRLATRPALEEAAGDLVADLHTRDALANCDHLARAIRQRDDVLAHRHPVSAAHNAEVAEIERAGRDLDQDLAIGRLGIGTLGLGQRLDARAALRQLIRTHDVLPQHDGRAA